MKRSTIVETISVLFMILFLYTGISKLMEYGVFREQLAESPILRPFSSFISWALPVGEFLLVIMLVVPRWRLKGLKASTALMIAFTLYIIALMSFNDQLPCSCGGVLAQLSWGQHIIFNSVFIVLGAIAVRLERKTRREVAAYWHSILRHPNPGL